MTEWLIRHRNMMEVIAVECNSWETIHQFVDSEAEAKFHRRRMHPLVQARVKFVAVTQKGETVFV